METVTVKKADLLAKITTNRESHRDQFLRAQEKYRTLVIEELDKRLEAARNGGRIDLGFALPEPADFTHSYDEAIAMLEWEIGDEVEIDSHMFRRLVLNQWEWARQFAQTTQAYLVN